MEQLAKSHASVTTGIAGMDIILNGGYPLGRPTVLRGTSGTGKTLFALNFACQQEAAGGRVVYATFDELPENLANLAEALGHEHPPEFLDFTVDPETELGGAWELGGLLARIELAIERHGAKCLVLDAIDLLFMYFEENPRVRHDLNRLFNWCRARGVTLLVTTAEGADYQDGTGYMDYASDCSIHLQQVVNNGLMTRTVHVLKCRGRAHGTNSYPFLIEAGGITVMPITDTVMDVPERHEHISTGIPKLDRMLGGEGLWAGNTCMISGESGTGKSLLALKLAEHRCREGEKVMYCSFEEAPTQLLRDAATIGLDLRRFADEGLLTLLSRRSVEYGLEQHILHILHCLETYTPSLVVLDPVSALDDMGNAREFKNTVLRLSHILKQQGVTLVLTELIPDDAEGTSSINVSSLVDTWIRLRRVEINREFRRMIYVHKSRGSPTENGIHEFRISRQGLEIDESW